MAKMMKFRVWRNGELLGDYGTRAEAEARAEAERAFDAEHHGAWGYSVGRIHVTGK